MGTPHATSGKAKLAQIAARAITEKWGTARVAEEAGVSYGTADRFISPLRGKIIKDGQDALISVSSVLANEAQKARDFALGQLARLRTLVSSAADHVEAMAPKNGKPGHPQKLDEFGIALPFDAKSYAQAVNVVTKTSKDLISFAEQATGLDVAKQIAIKAATAKDGPMASWDGVESLTNCIEADIIKDVERIAHAELEPPTEDASGLW